MSDSIWQANVMWLTRLTQSNRQWYQSLPSVSEVQNNVLMKMVQENAQTFYGKLYGFSSIKSVEEYQWRVPISTYRDLVSPIEMIKSGHLQVLTNEQATHFAITSGSTGTHKLIPYTQGLLNQFRLGIMPWIADLFSGYPDIMKGRSFWSISPVTKVKITNSAIPIGISDESMYFDSFSQRALSQTLIGSPTLSKLSLEEYYTQVLAHLFAAEDITWMSIWSPTFLPALLEKVHGRQDVILKTIYEGCQESNLSPNPQRARSVDSILSMSDHQYRYKQMWPQLQLISCWADGSARDVLPQLTQMFPHVTIQPKGLISTECFVSFPYTAKSASILSYQSHFFEFLNTNNNEIYLAHQLQTGYQYEVVTTTAGGLYRYSLGDVVEVVGHVEQCPLLYFVGRDKSQVVDLVGEKLNEQFVQQAVSTYFAKHNMSAQFWMICPLPDRSGYVLLIQTIHKDKLNASEIDNLLKNAFQYQNARELEQLQCLKIYVISDKCSAHTLYLETCIHNGQRMGDIKPTHLHNDPQWGTVFPGNFV